MKACSCRNHGKHEAQKALNFRRKEYVVIEIFKHFHEYSYEILVKIQHPFRPELSIFELLQNKGLPI